MYLISVAEPSLSSRAMLCPLSISMWSAQKHDPEASEEIAQRHGAQPGAGGYHNADRGERQKQILRGVYPERTRAGPFAALRLRARAVSKVKSAQDDSEGLRMTCHSERGPSGALLHDPALGR